MKKKIIKFGIFALVLGAVVGVGVFVYRKPASRQKVELSAEVYEQAEFREITAEELEQMIQEEKSFVVVVHMVVCPAGFPITEMAKRLAQEDEFTIYGLDEEEFRKAGLQETIKYLPSAVLYRDGKIVRFLDAEKDEDLEYYQSVGGLRKWIFD